MTADAGLHARRAVDAQIAVLACLAFLKDEDMVNASLVLGQFYTAWGEYEGMLDAANALLGAALATARDQASDSDAFRRLTLALVSDG